MANTKVTEALFQGNVTMNVAESYKKSQTDAFSFGQVMSETTNKNQPVAEMETDTSVRPNMQVDKSHKNPNADKINDKQQEITSETPDSKEKIAEEITDKAESVKEKIKDVFEVTDEEIEEVMATLGIMVQDLIIPDNLKQVMMEVSGIEDSMELLTNEDVYSGMQTILEFDSEVVEEITDEFPVLKDKVFEFVQNAEVFETISQKVPKEAITPDINGTEDLGKTDTQILTDTENVPTEINTEGIETAVTVADIKDYADTPTRDNNIETDDEIEVKDYSKSSDNSNVSVKVVEQSEKTDSFKNITASKKSDSNGEQNMSAMNEVKTTVTVNAEGNLVETIERFSENFHDAREIVSQVTETIKMNISADTTSMEMLLHPASLGTVNMQISSQNGVITAHILVQNEEVKAALETQLITLQETFEEQGHQVEAVEVTVANYNLDRGMQNGSNEQEKENALRSGRIARKRLKLDEISDEEFEELNEDEKVTADMMRRQGNSVDFKA